MPSCLPIRKPTFSIFPVCPEPTDLLLSLFVQRASQTFCVQLSWMCWHTEFPHTEGHIGRKIIPHSIKQLPWKTGCTRSDENIRISLLKETYYFMSATATTWSVTTVKPHYLMCSSGKNPSWCWWMKPLIRWPRRHRLERPWGRNLHLQLLPGT